MMIDLVSSDFWPVVPLVPHWGHIPLHLEVYGSSQILHDSLSLTGCSLRRGHDRYLTEPPRSIQLGLHFSALRCHYASPSGRYILDLWAWFSYGFGWLGSHVWWGVVSCHLFFWLVTHPMPYWGIFPFWVRFTDLRGGHVPDDRWFHDTCSFDLSHIWCHIGAYFRFG